MMIKDKDDYDGDDDARKNIFKHFMTQSYS